MKCPYCNGEGGSIDPTGEWYECVLCDETGKTTKAKYEASKKQIEIEDAEICRQMGEMADFVNSQN